MDIENEKTIKNQHVTKPLHLMTFSFSYLPEKERLLVCKLLSPNLSLEEFIKRVSEHALLSSSVQSCLQNLTNGNLEEKINTLTKDGIRFISYFDEAFPVLLREVPIPPLGLFFRGTLNLSAHVLSIVGSRDACVDACRISAEWSYHLAKQGVTILSGLALGVDGAAHRGALQTKMKGSTSAVLAHGLDRVYPSSHERLGREILDCGGALISEYPPGVVPLKHRFLERNRIIAGLSTAAIVIQAAERSGALATARYAANFGRDVGAVPWSPLDVRGAGCNKLIQQGAALLTSPDEVIKDLLGIETQVQALSEDAVHPLLALLKKQRSISFAFVQSEYNIQISETELLHMELDGKIMRVGDMIYGI